MGLNKKSLVLSQLRLFNFLESLEALDDEGDEKKQVAKGH